MANKRVWTGPDYLAESEKLRQLTCWSGVTTELSPPGCLFSLQQSCNRLLCWLFGIVSGHMAQWPSSPPNFGPPALPQPSPPPPPSPAPLLSPHARRLGVTPSSTTPSSPAPPRPVRLVGGTSYSGRVEIFHDGSWGTVCDDDWGINDAHVVCRSLGLGPASSALHGCGTFGCGSGQIWMDDLGCSGSEVGLEFCNHKGWGSHNCGHYEDAAVVCAVC